MKHIRHLLLCFLAFSIIFQSIMANDEEDDHRDTFGVSFFHARSASNNNAEISAGLGALLTQGYDECSHGLLWVTGAYASSFNQRGLGQYLFFNGSDTMETGTAGGPGIAVFGQNFLVNDNFFGAVTAHPRVTNALVDANFFYSLDYLCDGLYLFAQIPYVSARWNVDLKETVTFPGNTILANELGNPTNAEAPFQSMIEAWNGQGTFYDVRSPLQYARICGSQQKAGLSDITLWLGYAFINDDCNFFSINIQGVIPTSNRPTGEFLFEPLTGNGHYGAVGAGILGNFYIWEGCSLDTLSVFVNANILTMLGTCQHRTFDLTLNGPGSRYLLFKRFANNIYAEEIVRGPNILTLPVKASNAARGDCVLMFEYIRGSLVIDGGYNLWGRTRDHLEILASIPENTYGVAGLSGTAANANLTASQTLIDGTNAHDIDVTPIYISNANINIKSAAHPGAFSHGFFTHIQYIWDKRYAQPFIGVGSEVEYSGTNKSLLMWHIWAKTGFSF